MVKKYREENCRKQVVSCPKTFLIDKNICEFLKLELTMGRF